MDLRSSLALLLISLLVLPLFSISQNQTRVTADNSTYGVLFQRTWGGPDKEAAIGLSMDNSSGLYITGWTRSFGGGGVKLLALKYNTTGSLQWARTWGRNTTDDFGQRSAVDAEGNIYITGLTEALGSDYCLYGGNGPCQAFLLKFAPNGTLLWQRLLGGSGSSVGTVVATDSSGDLFMTGYTNNSGAGGDDVLLLKFDSNGTLIWQRTWGGVGADHANGLTVDSLGNLYVTGSTTSFGYGNGDLFLVKFNSTGYPVWQRTWGGPGFDQGFGVAVNGTDSIYVTGRTLALGSRSANVVLLKFDPVGNLLWQRQWGTSTGDHVGNNLNIDNSGNIYVSGRTGTSPTDVSTWDALLLKFNSAGNLTDEKSWGAIVGGDEGQAIQIDPSGTLYIEGEISEPQPFSILTLNLTATDPNFTPATPAFPAQTPSIPSSPLNVTTMIPQGNTTYAGNYDVFLIKYGLGTPEATPPSPPQNLQLSQASKGNSLNWQIPKSDGGSAITGYRIYRGQTGVASKLVADITSHTFSFTDSAASGSSYYYYARAVNAAGESSSSSLVGGSASAISEPLTLVIAVILAGTAVAVLSRRKTFSRATLKK